MNTAGAGGRTLFVYWRIDPAALPATLAAVQAAQAALVAGWPGLEARLWWRDEGGDGTGATPGPATVMESYAAPGGIDAAAQARIDAALAARVPATRHVEAFVPVPAGPAAAVRG